MANLFASFFKSNFSDANNVYFDSVDSNSSINFGSLVLEDDDIRLALSTLTDSCKPDIDGLSPFCLKMCSDSLCPVLTLLFNLSLKSGIVPDNWKVTSISPLFKKGDKSNVENYRPIAKLSTISKIFESIVKLKLSFVLKNVISADQHGFMQGRSTVSNLAVFTRYCSVSLAINKQVDVIYTDFAKAFDSVSHDILLHKLSSVGFHSSFLQWIKSYLANRMCFVVVNGCNSNSFVAKSGVPQGSILGPLLFNVFINDIVHSFSFCKVLLYADDLKLYHSVDNEKDCALIQNDIDKLLGWCSSNKLNLNVKKCFVMSYTRSRSPFASNYTVNRLCLSRVSVFNDLGVVFDSALTFVNHVNYIIPKARQALGFIMRHSKKFHDPYSFKALFVAFVRSRLEYASYIWNPFYDCHSLRIETIQNKFTRFALRLIFNCGNLPSAHSRNLLLGLKSLEEKKNIFYVVCF